MQNVEQVTIEKILPHPDNPRRHSKRQIRKIARSIKNFGFRFPVLIDRGNRLISGHGRLEAARSLNLSTVPVLRAEDLTEAQARALMIADNQIGDLSDWDDDLLAGHFEFLLAEDLDFNIEDTGFDYGDIEVRVTRERKRDVVVNEDTEPPLDGLQVIKRVGAGDL